MKTFSKIALPTDKQPTATVQVIFFLHATTVSLMKLIFYIKNKRTVDSKLQDSIDKKNSVSGHLEKAKSRNVLI